MNKIIIPTLSILITAAFFASPAFARRDVMVMLEEIPMTGTPPKSSYPVTVEVKMSSASMAEMKENLVADSMTLTCMPFGPQIMMCHGK